MADARKLWGQLRRTELVDEAVAKAQNQGSGFENGLRTQFRSILNSPQKRKGFSPDEISAFEDVVQGTAKGNLLKKAGKLGIGQNAQSNGLASIVGFGTLGPIAPIIGTMAQRSSEKSTQKAADFARALTASGGRAPKKEISAMQRMLIENLTRRGARTTEIAR